MSLIRTSWAAFGPTALFVLLWSAGALFAKWGLMHASAFAFLVLRFALALLIILPLAIRSGPLLPQRGTRLRVAVVGLSMVGCYAVFYLLALDHGLTPGVLATLLGAQPIVTLLAVERGFTPLRLAGLLLVLAGVGLVVADSILAARFSVVGVSFALMALACMTLGAIGQKSIREAPLRVLPLQYALSLVLCLALLPLQPLRVDWTWGLLASLLAMGGVISVAATLLLYRLIQRGNLVNVTSLFYLVPAGTATLDWLVFGNALAPAALAGMGAIVAGLVLVFRAPVGRRA
jgi:drug/metabolite transporter (DMT)-like permease